MMSACSVTTALSMPAMISDSERCPAAPVPLGGVSIAEVSTSDASGATPLIVNVQPFGRPENGSSLE
jgi:hypothetical protein